MTDILLRVRINGRTMTIRREDRVAIFVVSLLTTFILASFSLAQFEDAGPVIEIKGEVQQPTAIISLSRTRPAYKPSVIDSIKTNYAETTLEMMANLIAPFEDEKLPRKIENLKAILAKERH